MEWFFLAVVFVFLGSVTFVTGAALIATTSMRRANRLLPGGRAGRTAPLRWLWSPGTGAVLHRRLRNACQLVTPIAVPSPPAQKLWRRSKPAPVDGITALAQEVLREALSLDDQVVAASRLGPGSHRSQAMAALHYQVSSVEDAARRVHQLAARRAQLARLPSEGTLSLEQRIAALEDAFGELSRPRQV